MPYPALHDIDHTKSTAKSLQANGDCERFHWMSRGRTPLVTQEDGKRIGEKKFAG